MLGGIGGRRRRGWQRKRWLDGITDSMEWVWVNSGSWWRTGRPGVLQFMGSQRVEHDWATELNWTELRQRIKSRDITLPTKFDLVKAVVFLMVMYGCNSWTVKKAEHQRIDAFELWCWRRLLRVPWIARRSNQSILKELSSGISLEGMMLKLKLQYFGHLIRRVDSLEKTLMLGGIGGRRKRDDRGWDGWMASPTWWMWVWVNSGNWWLTGRPGVLQFMRSQRVGHDWATELNWTELIHILGLPWCLSGKECTCQCNRHGFNPWVRKITWRRKWPPSPVLLPEQYHWQRNPVSYSPWDCNRFGHDLETKQQQYIITLSKPEWEIFSK